MYPEAKFVLDPNVTVLLFNYELHKKYKNMYKRKYFNRTVRSFQGPLLLR